MKTLNFSVTIQAPKGVVWDVMLGSESYKDWTAVFTEGSYYEGSWDEGARIRFLGPDGSGLTSVISENRPHEHLSIKHLGEIAKGVDDIESDRVRRWAPCFENYTFTSVPDGTALKVTLEVTPDFEQYMHDLWPKALARLKALCEVRAEQRA